MSAHRWSTFTVLCLLFLAAMLGFCGGKYYFSVEVSPASLAGKTVLTHDSPAAPKPKPEAPSDALAPEPESPDALCRRLITQAATPARNDALLAAIEKMAEKDPLGAIGMARNETNRQLRQQLLAAAFRGWGRTDAPAAADWILAQPSNSLDANTDIAAVLQGAAQNPDVAVQLTQQLSQKNPDQAREYGDALIYALGQNGNFQRAADFAATGSDGLRTEWLAAAYGNWANYQPQNAAASAMQISDADEQHDALDAVIADWGQVDPKGLADFAENDLPAGDQKTHALSQALVFWAASNPVDAANWINQFSQSPSPAFDQGAAAIATQPGVMQQPQLAISWAANISDVNLRSRTMAAIVETWLLSDPSAAQNFVQNSDDLTPEDRTALDAKLNLPQN
jgi:hypothetical protein